MPRVVVVDYDPRWPEIFEQLRSRMWPSICDVAVAVEHVGSTAVPRLAAKPIVDISVVVRGERDAPAAIARLAGIGYVHQGSLGIDGREAFGAPAFLPPHHLYLCQSGSLALRNHLAVRDYLRAHPAVAADYGALKKRLANQFPDDVASYVEQKTDTILGILRMAGFDADELERIERINRRR